LISFLGGLLLSALLRPSFLCFHSLALPLLSFPPPLYSPSFRASADSHFHTATQCRGARPHRRRRIPRAPKSSPQYLDSARVRTTSGPRAPGASIRARPCTITPLRFRHLVCSLLRPGTRRGVDRRPNREIRERKGG
jgi:hypothetical protein